MDTIPAPMPAEFVKAVRPPAALKPHLTYAIEVDHVVVDRDGGTWVSPKASIYPNVRTPRNYVSIKADENHALTLFNFPDGLAFTVSGYDATQMKRRGYIPVFEIEPDIIPDRDISEDYHHEDESNA